MSKKFFFTLMVVISFGFVQGCALSCIRAIDQNKIYIDMEKLVFSGEGIFVQISRDEWLQVNLISYDAKGYFIPSSHLTMLAATSESSIWDYWRCCNGHLNPPWSTECGICDEKRY